MHTLYRIKHNVLITNLTYKTEICACVCVLINLFLQAHMNDIKATARVTLKICRFNKRFGTKTPGLRIQRKEIIKRTALL